MKKVHFFLSSILLLVGILFNSCSDDSEDKLPVVIPEPPKAIIAIVIVDMSDVKWPVPNCEVWLEIPEGTTDTLLIEYATKPKLTDIYGKVEYEFTSEGILTVSARKGEGAESCGSGVLILKEDEVYEEEIRLGACD